jgi:hypothetical protein
MQRERDCGLQSLNYFPVATRQQRSTADDLKKQKRRNLDRSF